MFPRPGLYCSFAFRSIARLRRAMLGDQTCFSIWYLGAVSLPSSGLCSCVDMNCFLVYFFIIRMRRKETQILQSEARCS